METSSEVIEILNDLVLINNDRTAGYEKAYAETKEVETDLRAMFLKMGNDSKEFAFELGVEVKKLGGEPETGTMLSGKLYRAWMDIRSTFTTDNRLAVLQNSELGEDAAQKAYEEALKSEELPADIRQLIMSQKTSLKSAHDTIKRQRDEQKEVGNYPLTS